MNRNTLPLFASTEYRTIKRFFIALCIFILTGCSTNQQKTDQPMNQSITAAEILGNPKYQAISYGGYREITRDTQPTIPELKEDMKILSAMGIGILRTYNTHYKQANNLLQAIHELREEDPSFEMYVMLGAWIDCKNAWTNKEPNHDAENEAANSAEIQRAVDLATQYPDIVKIIAVGNEAMVKWAASYYVQPKVILRWVNHLQNLKKEGTLNQNLWITSSDNFASWGGGDSLYHCQDLEDLIKAVDFVSLHTYPMHDTHYHPVFWGSDPSEQDLGKEQKIKAAMLRAKQYAMDQYASSAKYIQGIDSTKSIHIGETGWASYSRGHYGDEGSKACDEYKEGLYYHHMREWTNEEGIACFYFEAFNEKWKDAANPGGSENHFGIFNIDGEAKYAVWDLVDQGVFEGLSRNGNAITKSFSGDKSALMNYVKVPPLKKLK